jgi:hypothetical protein
MLRRPRRHAAQLLLSATYEVHWAQMQARSQDHAAATAEVLLEHALWLATQLLRRQRLESEDPSVREIHRAEVNLAARVGR